MLAWRLSIILPAMTQAETRATMRSHIVAGRTGARTALVTTRPCRPPTRPSPMWGGSAGAPVPMPGQVSLTRHGEPFLDARPEFRRHVLEVLRQPLEESVV